MVMRKIRLSHKPLIGLCIVVLCFVTGIDDFTGFWQQYNAPVPLIQSANNQSDGDDFRSKSLSAGYALIKVIDVSVYPSVSFLFLNEIECSSNLVYLKLSNNRAPPSC
jgi:hypothetical protein